MKCILPFGSKGVGLTVDAHHEGPVCDACMTYTAHKHYGEAALLERLRAQSEHSCDRIGVTVSGGRDSLFAWEWLTQKLGERCVVALNHRKVGLVSDAATQAIYESARRLGSEVAIVDDEAFLTRFGENLVAFLQRPDPAMVSIAICAGCRFGITGRMFHEARKLGVRTVVNGQSYLQRAPFKAELLREKGDGDLMTGLHYGLSENPAYDLAGNLQVILLDSLHGHWESPIGTGLRVLYPDIDYVDLYDYIAPTTPEEVASVAAGAIHESHQRSDVHSDCLISMFKDYLYFGLLGYTERTFYMCEEIRAGLTSRDEALDAIQEHRQHIIASADDLIIFVKKKGFREAVSLLESFRETSPFLIG